MGPSFAGIPAEGQAVRGQSFYVSKALCCLCIETFISIAGGCAFGNSGAAQKPL